MHAPIVLLHGTNAGPWTMANFAALFADRGFRCHSPAYRFQDEAPSVETSSRLTGLSIADYVDDVVAYVSGIDAPPILVGHSLGGVVAQLVAVERPCRGIIQLNGSVNWGVLPATTPERELARALMSAGPFWDTTLLPDFETMVRYGLNKLEPSEQRSVFDRLGPESGRVMFELFFWMFDERRTTKIDYDRIDCPVLMVSGSDDLAVPPSTARTIAERYGSRATFHEAKGVGHYLMLEPKWQEIADFCGRWMADVAA